MGSAAAAAAAASPSPLQARQMLACFTVLSQGSPPKAALLAVTLQLEWPRHSFSTVLAASAVVHLVSCLKSSVPSGLQLPVGVPGASRRGRVVYGSRRAGERGVVKPRVQLCRWLALL